MRRGVGEVCGGNDCQGFDTPSFFYGQEWRNLLGIYWDCINFVDRVIT